MKRRFLSAAFAGTLALSGPAAADEAALPGNGFAAPHYEVLWTKSPFSVASTDMATASPDYTMVGVAQFDGVSYVSLIDRQSQEHFLLTSDKPQRGLTLVSITRGHGDVDPLAVIQKNGESITLKLEQQPVVPAPQASAAPTPPPTPPGYNGPGDHVPAWNGQTPLIRHRPTHIIQVPAPPATSQPPPQP